MDLVSIIIPAYNEEKNLPATIVNLQNIFKSLNQKYEIIVANNNSTDKTEEIAKKSGCVVINQDERNIGKTRNAGADKANGSVLIFVDADSLPSKKLITQALSALTNKNIYAVTTITTFTHYPTLFSYGVWFYNLASKLLGLGVGQFIAIKAKTFKELNGFDQSYYAFEEINFFKRLKQKFGHKALFVSLTPIQTSPRKFEKGKTDTSKFLLLLTLSVLGFKVGRDKTQLDFWYKPTQNLNAKQNEHYQLPTTLRSRYVATLALRVKKLTSPDLTVRVLHPSRGTGSANYKKHIYRLLFVMLNFDILFLLTNSPIRNFSHYTTPIVFLLFLILLIDSLKSLKTFLIIWILTIFIEIIGVKTGFPFGVYQYNPNHIQVGILGVPIFIGMAWFVITASIYQITKNPLYMTIGVVLVDLLLEVFAIANDLWQWQNPTFLTAPYQNYLAWGVIGYIAFFILKGTNFSLKYSLLSLLALGYYMIAFLAIYKYKLEA